MLLTWSGPTGLPGCPLTRKSRRATRGQVCCADAATRASPHARRPNSTSPPDIMRRPPEDALVPSRSSRSVASSGPSHGWAATAGPRHDCEAAVTSSQTFVHAATVVFMLTRLPQNR